MASSLVNNKYRITRRIGGGSFGEIYMGVGPNNEKVAVKFERHGTRCPQLRHEYKVYRELTNCHGFCQVYYFGTQDNYNVMVMDLLGLSLEDLFNKCNRRFSLKTVLQIADQMLERADTLHSRHLIHRDIKPANFVIGVSDQASNIFCVDFGLSKRYRHPKNLQHIPHRDGRSLTGTPRYASINNHLGIEQSRRDDLESIGYVLIYFLKGSLPWQGLKAKNAQKKYRLILEKKQQVSIAQLCQGCPSQFAEFLAYTRSLKFDAKPDIPYLRKLFRDLYHAQNCAAIPKLWDWDGMENDYNSVSAGSTGGPPGVGGTPIIGAGGVPVGLRPGTAAAVVSNQLEAADLMALGGGQDDLELDEPNVWERGMPKDHRPSTAGEVMNYPSNANRGGAGVAGANWGYARPDAAQLQASNPSATGKAGLGPSSSGAAGAGGAGGMGIADYGGTNDANNVARTQRPHTAHGGRAGFPSAVPGGVVNPSQQQQQGAVGASGVIYSVHGDQEEDAHVVAGARGMMRYRRNRATADVPGQAPSSAGAAVGSAAAVPLSASGQVQSYGAGGAGGVAAQGANSNWAVYQSQGGAPGAGSGAGGGARGGGMVVMKGDGTMEAVNMTQAQLLAARMNKQGAAQQVPGGGGSGWPVSGAAGPGGVYTINNTAMMGDRDRPKSANQAPAGGMLNAMSSSGVAGGGGVGRPASSTQAMSGNSATAVSQWPQQQQQGQGANPTNNNNNGGPTGSALQPSNNTLSYGSLKNRFLSGNTGASAGTGAGVSGTAAAGNASNTNATNASSGVGVKMSNPSSGISNTSGNNNNSNSNTTTGNNSNSASAGKSKLFSLAR